MKWIRGGEQAELLPPEASDLAHRQRDFFPRYRDLGQQNQCHPALKTLAIFQGGALASYLLDRPGSNRRPPQRVLITILVAKIDKAVLLAAGRGTRMREMTTELPKPMLEVRGRPVLQHIV